MSETLEKTERDEGPLRVLLVDDHDLFRTGLRNLLEEQGVEIIGEAGDGAQAVTQVRELAPDVVVMDLNMPGMSGVEATRQVSSIAPLTRVVVLTISDQDTDVLDAILAGACGYLMKDASIDELMAGIRAAVDRRVADLVSHRRQGATARSRNQLPAGHRGDDSHGAVGTGDRGAEADRERQGQRDDRRRAAHQPEDRQEPHLEHPDEAPDREPDPGGRLRGPLRHRLSAELGGVAKLGAPLAERLQKRP